MFHLEDVIEAKFPAFGAQSPAITRPMVAMLKKLMREDEINAFLAQCGDAEGFEFVDKVLEYFNFSYTAVDRELENIPRRAAW